MDMHNGSSNSDWRRYVTRPTKSDHELLDKMMISLQNESQDEILSNERPTMTSCEMIASSNPRPNSIDAKPSLPYKLNIDISNNLQSSSPTFIENQTSHQKNINAHTTAQSSSSTTHDTYNSLRTNSNINVYSEPQSSLQNQSFNGTQLPPRHERTNQKVQRNYSKGLPQSDLSSNTFMTHFIREDTPGILQLKQQDTTSISDVTEEETPSNMFRSVDAKADTMPQRYKNDSIHHSSFAMSTTLPTMEHVSSIDAISDVSSQTGNQDNYEQLQTTYDRYQRQGIDANDTRYGDIDAKDIRYEVIDRNHRSNNQNIDANDISIGFDRNNRRNIDANNTTKGIDRNHINSSINSLKYTDRNGAKDLSHSGYPFNSKRPERREQSNQILVSQNDSQTINQQTIPIMRSKPSLDGSIAHNTVTKSVTSTEYAVHNHSSTSSKEKIVAHQTDTPSILPIDTYNSKESFTAKYGILYGSHVGNKSPSNQENLEETPTFQILSSMASWTKSFQPTHTHQIQTHKWNSSESQTNTKPTLYDGNESTGSVAVLKSQHQVPAHLAPADKKNKNTASEETAHYHTKSVGAQPQFQNSFREFDNHKSYDHLNTKNVTRMNDIAFIKDGTTQTNLQSTLGNSDHAESTLLVEFRKRIKILENANYTSTNELSTYRQKYHHMSERCHQLEQRNQSLTNRVEDQDEAISRAETIEQALRKQNDKLYTETVSLRKNVGKLEQKIVEMTKSNDLLQEQLKDTQMKLVQTTNSNSDVTERLHAEIHSLRTELQQARQTAESERKKHDEFIQSALEKDSNWQSHTNQLTSQLSNIMEQYLEYRRNVEDRLHHILISIITVPIPKFLSDLNTIRSTIDNSLLPDIPKDTSCQSFLDRIKETRQHHTKWIQQTIDTFNQIFHSNNISQRSSENKDTKINLLDTDTQKNITQNALFILSELSDKVSESVKVYGEATQYLLNDITSISDIQIHTTKIQNITKVMCMETNEQLMSLQAKQLALMEQKHTEDEHKANLLHSLQEYCQISKNELPRMRTFISQLRHTLKEAKQQDILDERKLNRSIQSTAHEIETDIASLDESSIHYNAASTNNFSVFKTESNVSMNDTHSKGMNVPFEYIVQQMFSSQSNMKRLVSDLFYFVEKFLRKYESQQQKRKVQNTENRRLTKLNEHLQTELLRLNTESHESSNQIRVELERMLH